MTKYRWEFDRLEPHDSLMTSIGSVFEAVFREEWDRESLQRAIDEASQIALLIDTNDSPTALLGYGLYEWAALPVTGYAMLWERSVAILETSRLRGHGLGNECLRMALARQRMVGRVTHLGGRTQNPLVISRYRKQSPRGSVFPFDLPPTVAVDELYRDVRTCFGRMWKEFDATTGICRHAYRGSFGRYPTLGNARSVKDEAWLSDHWFRREEGDAVVVVAPV